MGLTMKISQEPHFGGISFFNTYLDGDIIDFGCVIEGHKYFPSMKDVSSINDRMFIPKKVLRWT